MKLIAITVLTLLSIAIHAVEYDFTPPEFKPTDSGTVFHFFLPTALGFAANVNLQAQDYAESLESYDKLSREQFKNIKWEVLEGGFRDNGELFYVYTGEMNGRKLQWYSRAFKQGDKVYLITATFRASRADSDGKILQQSVDSFKLK